MKFIVPVTMFGNVLMPCFVHEWRIGKGLYYLLYWSQYLVTYPRLLVSSCCFFLSFPGQVRRRVGSFLNWCTVLVTIFVCGNDVRVADVESHSMTCQSLRQIFLVIWEGKPM